MKHTIISIVALVALAGALVAGIWWSYEQPCQEANEVYGYEIKHWRGNCYVKMHNGKWVGSGAWRDAMRKEDHPE